MFVPSPFLALVDNIIVRILGEPRRDGNTFERFSYSGSSFTVIEPLVTATVPACAHSPPAACLNINLVFFSY